MFSVLSAVIYNKQWSECELITDRLTCSGAPVLLSFNDTCLLPIVLFLVLLAVFCFCGLVWEKQFVSSSSAASTCSDVSDSFLLPLGLFPNESSCCLIKLTIISGRLKPLQLTWERRARNMNKESCVFIFSLNKTDYKVVILEARRKYSSD